MATQGAAVWFIPSVRSFMQFQRVVICGHISNRHMFFHLCGFSLVVSRVIIHGRTRCSHMVYLLCAFFHAVSKGANSWSVVTLGAAIWFFTSVGSFIQFQRVVTCGHISSSHMVFHLCGFFPVFSRAIIHCHTRCSRITVCFLHRWPQTKCKVTFDISF